MRIYLSCYIHDETSMHYVYTCIYNTYYIFLIRSHASPLTGSHGVARDQTQALQYYERAAVGGSPQGMVGAANMYLKGILYSPP